MFMLYVTTIVLMISLYYKNQGFIVVAVTIWIISVLQRMMTTIDSYNLDFNSLNKFLIRKGKFLIKEKQYAVGVLCLIVYPILIMLLLQLTLLLLFLYYFQFSK